MGHCKDYLFRAMERGYEDSDKYICAGCLEEKYFSQLIRLNGEENVCSFCGKHRMVLSMNEILKSISNVVRREYLPAEGNAVYDQEEHEWSDSDGVIDHYDFVHEELNYYLRSDNDDFLREIEDKLATEERMPANKFSKSQEEIDMERWNKYCQLVRSTPLSAEQIVGLINPKNKKDIPVDLQMIQEILEMVYSYCKKMGMVKFIEGISSKKGTADIYRCVNYLNWNPSYAGLDFIPAILVGTAPAKNVADSRMSEQGDMMFYGADNKNTAMIEVGRNRDYTSYPATMGTFHSNKRFRILDLAELGSNKLPSIFDIDKANDRSIWFFLNEFIRRISQPKNDKDNFYKPTQVFTKFIQRNTNLKGIKFKSSKADGNCYVLFVVNRDCLDKGDKTDGRRSQLVMDKVEQIDFGEEGIPIKSPECIYHDENDNAIYYLTKEDKEHIIEHKKFYKDLFRFGNWLLDSFKEPIADYELTIFSTYYRILELLDTLEVMTVEALINSGFIVVRSLVEAVGMLCYVLCDDSKIEKKAIIWQMMDIKSSTKDETLFYQRMQSKDCYSAYVSVIKDAGMNYKNWYSYCEGKKTNISSIFKMAGLNDLYDNLYRQLCVENHEVNHMESNIDCIGEKFYFKAFRNFENNVLLLNSVIRAMIPVNDRMVERYGDHKMKVEWKEYRGKVSEYVEGNTDLTVVAKMFNPFIKWF